MRFLTSLIVGVPTTYLILAIATGGSGNAISILIISIVCTAGISLAIWIPLMAGVGFATITIATAVFIGIRFVIRSIVIILMNQPDGSLERLERMDGDRTLSLPSMAIAAQIRQQLHRSEQIALKHYTKRAIALGQDYSRILSTLTEQGWSEDEVQQAYEAVAGS
jgi:hypothetical protein